MGSVESKQLHPKNEELLKYKKKQDTTPIKDAKLVTIWVIGSVFDAAKELGSLIANRMGYIVLSEKDLLTTEAMSNSERGQVVKDILQDKGLVNPMIVLDLLIETLLAKLSGNGVKGVVLVGIPQSKNQARHLEKITGPERLIVHMKFSNEAAKSALLTSGCLEDEVKKRIEAFNTHSLPLTRHKRTVTVNGEAGATSCFNELSEKLSRISASSL